MGQLDMRGAGVMTRSSRIWSCSCSPCIICSSCGDADGAYGDSGAGRSSIPDRRRFAPPNWSWARPMASPVQCDPCLSRAKWERSSMETHGSRPPRGIGRVRGVAGGPRGGSGRENGDDESDANCGKEAEAAGAGQLDGRGADVMARSTRDIDRSSRAVRARIVAMRLRVMDKGASIGSIPQRGASVAAAGLRSRRMREGSAAWVWLGAWIADPGGSGCGMALGRG